jgi:hypothetical protein
MAGAALSRPAGACHLIGINAGAPQARDHIGSIAID